MCIYGDRVECWEMVARLSSNPSDLQQSIDPASLSNQYRAEEKGNNIRGENRLFKETKEKKRGLHTHFDRTGAIRGPYNRKCILAGKGTQELLYYFLQSARTVMRKVAARGKNAAERLVGMRYEMRQ